MEATITISDAELELYTDASGYQEREDQGETREEFFKRKLQQDIVLSINAAAMEKSAREAARIAREAAETTVRSVSVE